MEKTERYLMDFSFSSLVWVRRERAPDPDPLVAFSSIVCQHRAHFNSKEKTKAKCHDLVSTEDGHKSRRKVFLQQLPRGASSCRKW
jgi:hypothetical protein